MGFYNLYKIFKDIFKTIFGYKNFRKLLIFLVIGAFCFYCFSSLNVVFGADTATTDDQLVTTYQRASQDSLQNMLVINSIKPFVGNTDYWNNVLKPIFDDVYKSGAYVSIVTYSGNHVYFTVWTNKTTTELPYSRTVTINGNLYNFTAHKAFCDKYSVDFNISTNFGSSSHTSSTSTIVPDSLLVGNGFYVSSSLAQFMEFINSPSGGSGGSSIDYTELLNIINNSLNSINSSISNLDTNLSNIKDLTKQTNDILNTIKSKLDNQKDYTNQLDTVNQSLQNLQNTYQEQQEQTRQQISDSTNQITNTLTDNNVDNIDTSDLQNQDTTDDITQNGFNSIFTTIQNAFLDNTSKSIVFEVPFTDKSFTISKSTIYGEFSSLNTIESFASMVWYFLISLFIVKDISKKISKIKSGDIDNIQNDNIKEDLL